MIELLVVMAVMSIITGITWANFNFFGRIFDMERDVNRIAQDVRRSLEMTMAMEDFSIPGGCESTDVVVSYGLNLQTQVGTYDRVAYIIDANPDRGTFGSILCEEVIEEVNLEQGLISTITVFNNGSPLSRPNTKIIFVPPHPRTFIGGIEVYILSDVKRWRSLHDSVEVTVSMVENPSGDRTIKINRAGLIEIIQPL